MHLEVWLKYTHTHTHKKNPYQTHCKLEKKNTKDYYCNFCSVTDAYCGLLVGDAGMLTQFITPFKLGVVSLCNDTGCKYRLLISLSSVYKCLLLFSVSVSELVSGEIKIHICAIEKNGSVLDIGGGIMHRNPHCTNN